MKPFQLILVIIITAAFGALSHAVQVSQGPTIQEQATAPTTQETPTPTVQLRKVTAYTLPPDLYRKARNLSKIRFRLALIGFVYGLIVLWLILQWKLAPKYRDWAEKFSMRRFLQGVIFAPLLLLTVAVLTLPLDIYGEWVEKQYGISVQSWPSWSWDWIKAELISLVIGTFCSSTLLRHGGQGTRTPERLATLTARSPSDARSPR